MLEYDFIIVGGGSAGATLATRLTDNPERSVLLLEAGPDYAPEQVPQSLRNGNTILEAITTHDWGMVSYKTTAQDVTPLPRGKVTGGSSAVNGAVWLRAAPQDFEQWASMGNDEWSFEDVLPYFRKSETDLDHPDDFHGTRGPIPVRRHPPEEYTVFSEAFTEAARDYGLPDDPDMNHPETTGVGPWPMNKIDGTRMSTALTYLPLARHRLNLTIRGHAKTVRVLFEGKRAVGVEVDSGDERQRVFGEQIILCAGAALSPAILLHSGVGPAQQLAGFGIPLVHELPVGQHLTDHPMVGVLYLCNEGTAFDPDEATIQVGVRYTATGSDDFNDMQLIPSSGIPLGPIPDPAAGGAGQPPSMGDLLLAGQHFIRDRRERAAARQAPEPGMAMGFSILAGLETTHSVGTLELQSADPDVQPLIKMNHLDDPRDLERVREGIRIIVDIAGRPGLRDVLAERLSPTDAELETDEALDAWLMSAVSTEMHISGTCKMGPDGDPKAVVDQYCRVRGLDNLRVVDASVMPTVPRANTNATTVMIAERVADWIIEGR